MIRTRLRAVTLVLMASAFLTACLPKESDASGSGAGSGTTEPPPATPTTPTAPAASGTATLMWQAPTQYIDGSSLNVSDLAGYRVYHGMSQSGLAPIAELDSQSNTLTVNSLEKGTHYFAVTALSSAGMESGYSAIGSKTIL